MLSTSIPQPFFSGTTTRGSLPLYFIWKHENNSVGAEPQLTLENAKASDSGDYWCIVSNKWGADTSRKIHLDVTAAPIPVPVIDSVKAGDARVTVWWGTVPGATSYNLYYRDGVTVDETAITLSGATSPAEVTGLTNGTRYAFAVSAVTVEGESQLNGVQTAVPQAPVKT
ncbi:MAG: fibronectin type III domain-containing protein [Chitinispirillaceae bacterium]|nr:fibronectin type III domain-containing protein [Chitinispirillaceae bacterium]